MTQRHRPANLNDAAFVAANIRPADRAECIAATSLPPEIVLDHTVSTYGAEAIIAPTGEVVGLCGVVPTAIPGYGNVWMCATPTIQRYPRLLVRAAATWLAKKHRRYPRMGNIVDARNTLHVRWLSALGFKFTTVIIHGPQSLPFIQFERSA